jgi:3-oxoadipate enol-lactonase
MRLTMVDLRGHGSSPGVALSVEDHADDVATLIDSLGLRSPSLLGLSLGGMVAQSVALRRPNLLDTLILCGCAGGFSTATREAIRARAEGVTASSMNEVVSPTLARWFTDEFADDGILEAVSERLRTNDPAVWTATWRAISQFDALPQLHRLANPTLVVAGARDKATPLGLSRELADAIPGAQYLVVSNAPHMMHLERPIEFLETWLPRFLSGTTASPKADWTTRRLK